MTDKTKEALVHYEAALKEAFPSGATGDVFHHWNEARKALVEESSGTEQPDMNLNCKSVQARLATSWGYVKAEQPAQPQTDQSVTPEYLEWLDSIQPRHGVGGNEAWNAGVAWATAQPQQEPVAVKHMMRWVEGLKKLSDNGQHMKIPSGLSAGTCWELAIELEQFLISPPIKATPLASQRSVKPWVGLTDEEVKHEWVVWRASIPRYMGFAKGIEAKLKEKNA